MGCNMCKRTETTEETCGKDEQCTTRERSGIRIVPSFDFPKQGDARKSLGRYTLTCNGAHGKLVLDRGRVPKKDQTPVQPIQPPSPQLSPPNVNLAAEGQSGACMIQGPSKIGGHEPSGVAGGSHDAAEEDKGSLNRAEQSLEGEPSPLSKRQSSQHLGPTGLGNFGASYRRANTPAGAMNTASIASLPSLPYDQSYLVLENIGKIYDTYQIMDTLGRGAFGEVKKVKHRASGIIYAMKMINRNCCVERANVVNEIEILKKLVLSHLITLL